MKENAWADPSTFLAFEFQPSRLKEFAGEDPARFNMAVDMIAGRLKEKMGQFSTQSYAMESNVVHCVDRHYIKDGQQCTETTCYDETGAIVSQVEVCHPIVLMGQEPPPIDMGDPEPDPPQMEA